jgi:hypothetical protein
METQLDDVYFITKGECYIAKTFDLLYQLRRDNSMRIMMPPSLIGRRAVTVIDESDALSLAQSKTTWTHHGASILDYMSAEEISYLVAGRRKRYQPIRAVKALVQLRVLGSGDFFGVGEYLTESRVITTKKVECLLVSRLAFIKHDQGVSLEELKREANSLLPSTGTVYRKLVQDNRWNAYKKSIVTDIIGRRSSNRNKTHASTYDAPGHLAQRKCSTDMPIVSD